MPSSLDLPTVKDLERAFHAAVGSERKTEDAHDGSVYDRFSGIGALTMRRIAERDQSEARAIFFDTATDDKLDTYVEEHFGEEFARTQDGPGVGTAQLSRSSGTSGTFLAGTRIAVGRGGSDPAKYWSISADVPVGAVTRASVPIRASEPGPAGRVSLARGDVAVLQVADPLWDNTWQVDQIDCAPGTLRQEDPSVRAGIRQTRVDGRPGFQTAIISAMVAAGASTVALYSSDFLGSFFDVGLNRIYVGDTGFESPLALLNACRLAVPNICVAGSSVQVLPMRNALLYVRASVRLWTSPERLNQVQAEVDAQAAIVEYFARRDNAFIWSGLAIRAAVMKAIPNVHSVTVSVSSDAAGLVPVAEPALISLFAASPLPRYRVMPPTVGVSLFGPT
jgi:hypothetical protein